MNVDEPLSYDLIDQPWLLVRDLDGGTAELSLLDTFRRASRLMGLVGDVPTQVFALTRLLLAVLHRAVAGPRDLGHWERLWAAAELPMVEIENYLDRHRARFDLLHPEAPFLQVSGLHTVKGGVPELNKLIADVPNGRPFFSTRLGPIQPLSFAEAARWLVHCHAFDPSGIKSGAAGDPRVKGGKGYPIGTGWSGYLGGVLPEGATLRETLLLNLIATDYGPLTQWRGSDAPAWERDQVGPGEECAGGRAPLGPTDLFTWQSRRILLSRSGESIVGALICNGDRIIPQNKHQIEPHTGWRRSQTQEKKLRQPLVYMPREHDPERAIWRGLQSLLPGVGISQGHDAAAGLSPIVLEWFSHLTEEVIGPEYLVRLRTIGMTYGSQSSTTEEIIDDALPLRAVLLRQDAVELVGVVLACVEAAEGVARALGWLAANLAAAAGGDGAGHRSRATELAFAELDVLFREWLAGIGPDTEPTQAQADWHRHAYRAVSTLARELLDRAPMTAWVGRTVKGRLVTSAHAQMWFQKELAKTLPLARSVPDEAARTAAASA